LGIKTYALVGFCIISLLFTQYAFAQVTSCPNPNDVIVGGVCVSAFGAFVSWDKPSYKICDNARITFVGEEENTNPDLIQIFFIQVTSDSDPTGVQVLMLETGIDTGVFLGEVQLCGDLNVFDGDKVYVSYGNSGDAASIESSSTSIPTTTPPTLPPTSPNTVFAPAGSALPGCENTDECFIPSIITVNVGDTVKWVNKDTAAHTVTSGSQADGPDGKFDSNLFMAGAEFSHTFDAAGKYPYFCMVHPWMAGIIIVESAPTPTPTPTIRDTTPPKILKPSDVIVDATDSNGARVTYDVLAIDDTDNIIKPTCRPSSGSIFPIGATKVTCTASDSAGNSASPVSFIVAVNAPAILIPDWIKEVASFWCDDKIDDSSFIEGIQYLIDNDIILVPSTSSGIGGSQTIPSWIKNNACWWSQNLISDEDFAGGLQYLIGQGIIRV